MTRHKIDKKKTYAKKATKNCKLSSEVEADTKEYGEAAIKVDDVITTTFQLKMII